MKKRIQQGIAARLARWLAEREAEFERLKFARFRNSPSNFVMDKPYRLIHPELMEIGDDVYLGPNSMLNCITEYPSPVMQPPGEVEIVSYEPRIVIGNKVSATAGLQVGACMEIIIEDDVLFASNVHMTDGFHGYSHVDLPYKFQPMWQISPIHIKRGSWIGQNVVISPGVTLGEMAIIGANSVVTRDVPDYSIAVGAPAKVIKSWCHDTNQWRAINHEV